MCTSEWSQGFTHTQDVDWGFLLSTTLQMGLLLSPITYKCLLRVLCPVRRPITTLDCVLLKDNNRAVVTRLGPEINSRACLCVLQGPCWQGVQIIELHNGQVYPASFYNHCLRPRYLSEYSLNSLSLCSSLNVRNQISQQLTTRFGQFHHLPAHTLYNHTALTLLYLTVPSYDFL
jgi:hypothetical protein